MYKIEANKIIFQDGKIITFDFNISKDSVVFDNVLIVVLSIPNSDENKKLPIWKRNAFGVDLTKETLLWQIEESPSITNGYSAPFVTKEVIKAGLWSRNGPHVILDYKTGKILKYLPGY